MTRKQRASDVLVDALSATFQRQTARYQLRRHDHEFGMEGVARLDGTRGSLVMKSGGHVVTGAWAGHAWWMKYDETGWVRVRNAPALRRPDLPPLQHLALLRSARRPDWIGDRSVRRVVCRQYGASISATALKRIGRNHLLVWPYLLDSADTAEVLVAIDARGLIREIRCSFDGETNGWSQMNLWAFGSPVVVRRPRVLALDLDVDDPDGASCPRVSPIG
jgi:hypothetical protein